MADDAAHTLSLIVPCYNEELSLPLFYAEACRVGDLMPYVSLEFIFVDDGSRDNTLTAIKRLADFDGRVRFVSFSRNFGKEAAVFAGLEHAKGDYIAFLDADLQHPPALLPQMYEAVAHEGFDSAATRRVTRKGEPPIRSFFARMFYKLMNKISTAEIVDGACDFRLMNRKFADALLSMREYNRFSKGLFGWVGFKTKWIEFENVERVAGETKWSFWKLFLYSLEGITAFSTAPLVISSVMGILFCVTAFLAAVFVVVRKILCGVPVAGWASAVIIVLFISGVQFLFLGVLGQYLSKMYLEIKQRPIYIVGETNCGRERKDAE